MYSCVYLIWKVVEKKIFYKKKFMKCRFKDTLLYTNYTLRISKKRPPCCGCQTL